MHSTIHAVCGQQKGQNRAESQGLILKKKNLVKRAGRHFGFFKKAGHHENGAGRRALQKRPRQNTVLVITRSLENGDIKTCRINQVF